MDLKPINRLLNIFKREPGLVMPPVAVYAAQFIMSSPHYNTGLFINLHGRPVAYLDQLAQKCADSALKAGMTVFHDFTRNVSNIPVDAPQVASLMASALGEMAMRYGAAHKENIDQWVRESFDDLLPPLKPAHRSQAVELFKELSQNRAYRENDKYREMIDKQAESLLSTDLVTASDLLILRVSHLKKASEVQLKIDSSFEP